MGTKSLFEAIVLLEARDWRGAHEIARDNDAPLASWAHGILHLGIGVEVHALAQRARSG